MRLRAHGGASRDIGPGGSGHVNEVDGGLLPPNVFPSPDGRLFPLYLYLYLASEMFR